MSSTSIQPSSVISPSGAQVTVANTTTTGATLYGDQTGAMNDTTTGQWATQARAAYAAGISQAQIIAAASAIGVLNSDVLKIIQN